MRFVDGAPSLEALINGAPQDIGAAYLQAGGETVASTFQYGAMTAFLAVNAGTLSLVARDTLGYQVGPLKSSPLAGGKQYTLVVVGVYPHYRVLTFDEPSAGGAAISLYEASTTVANAGFGRFRASTHSQFQTLGNAAFGTVTTASLGKSVSDVGGYVGPANAPIGTQTPSQIDGFDARNVLPFYNSARLSLFLFDAKPSSGLGPVFGSLDR
ncbi:MAG: DUF4397 domain-containing protein [Candidatus Eremiobacteraeota bacterium]|nr:DUF4397 domain-containing protein [Candidatus Eremiobacteraeota bacterium]